MISNKKSNAAVRGPLCGLKFVLFKRLFSSTLKSPIRHSNAALTKHPTL